MDSKSFGQIFRITTFGESHGPMIGVVIDGCPAGIAISETDIDAALALRQPGRSEFVTPRTEADKAKICGGVFEGKTTGAPIAIIIENKNVDSSKYEAIKDLLRPGHANYAYLEKYGVYDYRGGGRASARETACRVAAGAVAAKILAQHNIITSAYIKSIGDIVADIKLENVEQLKQDTYASQIFCPDQKAAELMMQKIRDIKDQQDSIGGVVEFVINGLPTGLGDPVYEKFDANLAKALMTIPGTKGFEIGEGFKAAQMQGSEHNDLFITENDKITLQTNHAGGVLGGITTGMPVTGRVAFKPTASIMQPQVTVDLKGKEQTLQLPEGSRHDPCIAIRAVPVVEAMCALVIVDALLLNKTVKI